MQLQTGIFDLTRVYFFYILYSFMKILQGYDPMEKKLFGTDGIRGKANQYPIVPTLLIKVAMAAAHLFTRGDHRHTVVMGKDTRQSGYMIETALTSAFTSMGVDVIQIGPMPTPAVAILTRA